MKYLTLLVPTVLMTVSILIFDNNLFLALVFPTILTITGIVIVVKRKLYSAWLLLFSFLISPLPFFFLEILVENDLNHLVSGMIAAFFALPFFLTSLIIAIVQKIRKNTSSSRF